MNAKRRKLIYNLSTYAVVVIAFIWCQMLLNSGGMTRSL